MWAVEEAGGGRRGGRRRQEEGGGRREEEREREREREREKEKRDGRREVRDWWREIRRGNVGRRSLVMKDRCADLSAIQGSMGVGGEGLSSAITRTSCFVIAGMLVT